MEISQRLKEVLNKYSSEINKYQFEGVYSKLEYVNDVRTFTEMMLGIDIDPAEHLGYIPTNYLENSEISSYQIPNNITEIKAFAFFECSNLTEITIPSKVTKIGAFAFGNCKQLALLTLPSSLQEIGDELVYRCSNLETIIFEGSAEQWEKIKKGDGLKGISVSCVG